MKINVPLFLFYIIKKYQWNICNTVRLGINYTSPTIYSWSLHKMRKTKSNKSVPQNVSTVCKHFFLLAQHSSNSTKNPFLAKGGSVKLHWQNAYNTEKKTKTHKQLYKSTHNKKSLITLAYFMALFMMIMCSILPQKVQILPTYTCKPINDTVNFNWPLINYNV